MANGDKITTKEVYRLVEETRKELKSDIGKIDDKISREYVTHDEFEPIKRLVYGVVGLILVAVVGALVAMVIQK
jgi:hypothetical protein